MHTSNQVKIAFYFLCVVFLILADEVITFSTQCELEQAQLTSYAMQFFQLYYQFSLSKSHTYKIWMHERQINISKYTFSKSNCYFKVKAKDWKAKENKSFIFLSVPSSLWVTNMLTSSSCIWRTTPMNGMKISPEY